jgi:predicted ATP-binding protein involved in virulence
MLTRIKIFHLFNVYNYDIDLTNADGTAVKFITAPNGYGKTTILDFVEAAMRQTYDRMFQMPFKSFELFFDEAGTEAVYQYSVTRTDEESKAVDTDIVQTLSKKLQIRLNRISGSDETLIEEFVVIQAADGSITTSGSTDNTQMFFIARTCFYLTDDRLLSQKMDVKDETLYIEDSPLRKYPLELKEILSSPEKSKEYESRIACFQAIINRCEFANKHLEIDQRFGFRFMAEDELHTILSLDQLSSGEKQMIIQLFELLFHAQSGTLVMIDEPELSLHMMWQMNYMKNLSEIAQLRGFQCIVATHSPQIFNSLWSKSVDLFTLSNQA